MRHPMIHRTVIAAVAAALAAPAVVTAQQLASAARDPAAAIYAPLPAASEQNGIPYLAGGVGLEAREAMRNAADEFNLRLSFAAAADGHYLADVGVTVRNARDEVVLELADTGPLLYARLPAGRYTVAASHDAVEQRRTVTIADGAPASAYFHWTGTGQG
ncbi:MAG: carboxypeptidase regulatory-like domain-containing protein [Burkholderiales bacterium]